MKKPPSHTAGYLRKIQGKFPFIATSLIVLLAVVLRFYDFAHRWSLASDQAGFAIVARYAIVNGKLPLVGPFSSAGPFQTGGEWYWIVMIGKLLFFNAVTSPWVFMTILSLFFVICMIYLGTKLLDRNFGLLTGLFAAISTGQITQSVNLTNQTPLMLFAAAAVYTAVMYTREKKGRYLFFLGLAVGTAASIHLQGVALAIVIIVTLIGNRVYNPKHYALVISGGLLPWIPVVLVDMQNNYFTFKNMFAYYFQNTNPISYEALGRRWVTFAGVFVPSAWAYTIGGLPFMGYVIVGVSGLTFAIAAVKKKISLEWLIIIISLGLMIGLLRYTRTPIFESYFVFIHPYILLVTAWAVKQVFVYKKMLGVVFAACIICVSLYRSVSEITKHGSSYADQIVKAKQILKEKYPNEKFSLYDFQYETSSFTQPLTLFLYEEDLTSLSGRKIGIAKHNQKTDKTMFPKTLITQDSPYALYDLSSSSAATLTEQSWSSTDPETVYLSVQEWFRK